MMIVTLDALHFLLLLEAAVVLCGTTIFFIVRNGRHKRLYQKTLKELASVTATESETALREEARLEAAPERPAPAAITEEREAPALPAAEESFGGFPDEMIAAERPASGHAEEETAAPFPEESPDGAAAGQVRRLQRMVDFQKSTILDLMCYKDLFESAQQRLAALQQSSADLQRTIRNLIDTGGADAGTFSEPLAVLERNNNDLDHYIGTLTSESEALSEKFRVWEDEFRSISEDLGDGGSSGSGLDEERCTLLLREKEELAARTLEVEGQLQEKSTMLGDLQRQYEDLEKEYMILYRQQQQGKL